MQLFRSRIIRFALALTFAAALVVGAVNFPTTETSVAEAASNIVDAINTDATNNIYPNGWSTGYSYGFEFTPISSYTFQQIQFQFGVTRAYPITAAVYDGRNGSLLASGSTVVSSTFTWVDFNLSSDVSFTGGQTYFIAFQPPSASENVPGPIVGGSTVLNQYYANPGTTNFNTSYTSLAPALQFIDTTVSVPPPAEPVTDIAIPAFDPNDDRLNQAPGNEGEPVAIYQGSVDVYGIDPTTSQGVLEIRVTDEEIEAAGIPSADEWSILLASGENRATGMPIEVYRLATGEFQVNTYYYTGKPYIFRWHPDRPNEGVHVAW